MEDIVYEKCEKCKKDFPKTEIQEVTLYFCQDDTEKNLGTGKYCKECYKAVEKILANFAFMM